MSDRRLKVGLLFVALVAFGVAATIAVAGPGTRLGLWEYGAGISIIRNMALPSMIAVGLAILAFIASLFMARNLAPLMSIAIAAATVAAIVPLKFEQGVNANPFIHDITTDVENPPEILVAADLPRKNPAAYLGADPAPNSEMTVAEAQRNAFPDIQPIIVDMKVDEAADISSAIIGAMNMEILKESTTDEGAIIEATYTSFWFGFVDDFIIRIRPREGKTRIDVRSKSRVGVSDLGANARRVRDFLSRFGEEAAS